MAASTRDIKIPLIIFLSSFLDLPSFFFGFGSGGNGSIFVTIQPPQNQLANIDFDVIGTSDYQLMEK